MRFAFAAVSLMLASTSFGTPTKHDKDNERADIFPNPNGYSAWAICEGRVTSRQFPTLQAPRSGGCVRYYRGIDMTGVVTELHFFFKDGFRSACDCVAKCLEQATSCNNWVWKHTFMDGDDGKRSCTLYSSPNLPSNVTLAYDLANSRGFDPLADDNNPQKGGESPFTFLDSDNKKRDRFGVSGFTAQDQDGGLYC
ncbi:hypothetical protein PCL_03215 [Purpureocillium lilacinum]|uniref:Apple domain-containing protein n=2 Tax=Purpureocillium lilacinum TaxID=33203 RepID=A0A2U3END5_PURLI|nr:hypothetical protein Purlil1_11861 [Purpureocillium lilacinum]PWI76021.1 hypothetical protein PCL_03215 [Purpureocillium lilacinum]